MTVIEQNAANGVRYALLHDGRRWGVRYAYADGTTDTQWKRTEREARSIYRAMVRAANIVASRKA